MVRETEIIGLNQENRRLRVHMEECVAMVDPAKSEDQDNRSRIRTLEGELHNVKGVQGH